MIPKPHIQWVPVLQRYICRYTPQDSNIWWPPGFGKTPDLAYRDWKMFNFKKIKDARKQS